MTSICQLRSSQPEIILENTMSFPPNSLPDAPFTDVVRPILAAIAIESQGDGDLPALTPNHAPGLCDFIVPRFLESHQENRNDQL